MQTERKSNSSRSVFLIALLAAVLIYLPFIIYNGGLFLYYGDFNVQQIPFYKLAHEAVRSGDIFWSWYTDLGANFIGSYSFYLLSSPFFWLTLPFPTSWVPYLMGPLLMLKMACAALTSYWYLRRFVKDERYAAVGSMLYAFSGWMIFNVFFNHFLDVAVFFPLLLLGVEKLVTEDKKGFFAAMVLLNAAVNYWFFVGEAIFVVIYVLLRATDRTWGMNLKKFLLVALEAVLGFGAAAFIVLPSVLALMGNPRTGGEEMLTGWNIWLYWHEQRYPAILQSLLFPPEMPARPNFLPDHGAKWASLSAWLPLLSVTGVLAYFFRYKNDWVKKVLGFSLLCALVPALNSMFVLFNHSYYARWFYMPVLLMALASARSLEDIHPSYGPEAADDYKRSIKWTAILVLTFAVMCGVTPHYGEEGELLFGLAKNPLMMWVFTAIAVVCLALTTVLVMKLRGNPRFPRMALAGVLVVSVGFSVFYIINGKNPKDRDQWLVDHAIHGREQLDMPDTDSFYRVDFYDSTDNMGMYLHLPTIQAFHSIVPPSIMEFYPAVGVTRDVGSRPEAEFYALRSLLSVKYLFIPEEKVKEELPLPGFYYSNTQNGFEIYENENYLPLGFAYDNYLTETELEDFLLANRSHAMLRALVLDEEAVGRNSDLLSPLDNEGYLHVNDRALEEDVQARMQMAASSVEIGRRGFSLTTNFDRDRLLFVSVPYESGWSASTTGEDGSAQPVLVERANIGFMAVRVPAGEQTVRFSYSTPGLTVGLLVTAVCLLVLAAYLLIARMMGRKSADGAVLTAVRLRGGADADEGAEGEKPAKKRREKRVKKPKKTGPAEEPPVEEEAPASGVEQAADESAEQIPPEAPPEEPADVSETPEPGEGPKTEVAESVADAEPEIDGPAVYFKAMEQDIEPPQPEEPNETGEDTALQPETSTEQDMPVEELTPPEEEPSTEPETSPEPDLPADPGSEPEQPVQEPETPDEQPQDALPDPVDADIDSEPAVEEATEQAPSQQEPVQPVAEMVEVVKDEPAPDEAAENETAPQEPEPVEDAPETPAQAPPEKPAPKAPAESDIVMEEVPDDEPSSEPPMQAGLRRDARLSSPAAPQKPVRQVRRDPRTGKPVTGPRRDPRTGKPLPPRRDPRDPKGGPK